MAQGSSETDSLIVSKCGVTPILLAGLVHRMDYE